ERRLREAAQQLAAAIQALHRYGRVHRDLKPSNVLVRDDGHLVLLDFGLVEKIGSDGRHDPTSAKEGTPDFMAPEQTTGERVGPEADWYAFGVMLFLALTGAPPFSGAPEFVIKAKCSLPEPTPREVCSDVPADLDELCRALLSRDPAQRPSGE